VFPDLLATLPRVVIVVTCSNLRHRNLLQKAVFPNLFATLPNVFYHSSEYRPRTLEYLNEQKFTGRSEVV
jgi:hypothetical protein